MRRDVERLAAAQDGIEQTQRGTEVRRGAGGVSFSLPVTGVPAALGYFPAGYCWRSSPQRPISDSSWRTTSIRPHRRHAPRDQASGRLHRPQTGPTNRCPSRNSIVEDAAEGAARRPQPGTLWRLGIEGFMIDLIDRQAAWIVWGSSGPSGAYGRHIDASAPPLCNHDEHEHGDAQQFVSFVQRVGERL